ncbi:MAG: hypothetical protein ABI356_02050 [Steroidobacteraceae bacterium]
MRKRLTAIFTPLSVAVGLSVYLCAAAAAASLEHASGDACRLLTAAQVTTALGVQVDEGTYVDATHPEFCIWRASGKPPTMAQNVEVHFMTARQFEAPKTGPFAKGPEAGLGDEAYWSYTAGVGFSLSIKKGSTYIRVQCRSPANGMARRPGTASGKAQLDEKTKSVEKTIGTEVLERI